MKYQVYVTLVIVAAVLLISAQGRSSHKKNERKRSHPKNSTDFDVFIFTQHWPPTVCYDWKEGFINHTCSLPKGEEEWSIHGIWPTQFHEKGPSFCNKTVPFNPADLKPIENELKNKWIDISNTTNPYSFWEHEWKKHGTCSIVLENVNTEYKYFKKGLDLFDKYDMKHVLAKANILPGESYAVQTILNGIEKVVGTRGTVECVTNKDNKEKYLFEIRICFDKLFNLTHCDGISNFPTNCPRKKPIFYPGTVPNAIDVIFV